MQVSVTPTSRFSRLLRKLARKFPSAVDEVEILSIRVRRGEGPGKPYRRMGGNVYRVRLPNRSARRGKSAGFRNACCINTETCVLLLAICDRKDCAELEESNLRALIPLAGL